MRKILFRKNPDGELIGHTFNLSSLGACGWENPHQITPKAGRSVMTPTGKTDLIVVTEVSDELFSEWTGWYRWMAS